MKRWGLAIASVILMGLWIWFWRASGQWLLTDTDTAEILRSIDARHSPLSWFAGDWPLHNHFYRPIVALVFEFDRALYGGNGAGFGATNAALVIGCLAALAWLVRELSDSPLLTAAATALFGFWCLNKGDALVWAPLAMMGVALIGSMLPGRRFGRGLVAGLLWVYVAMEIAGLSALMQRTLLWIPGRTATTATFFGLLGLAALARFYRIASPQAPLPPATALDEPATRHSTLRQAPSKLISWSLVSFGLMMCLVLGAYEQAVALPIVACGLAWIYRGKGLLATPKWAWIGFAALAAYLAVRFAVVPHDASSYQDQQIRFSSGSWLALADWIAPAWVPARGLWVSLAVGWAILFSAAPWISATQIVANLCFFGVAKGLDRIALWAYAASLATYFPMAFLKPFDHYAFMPMAFRAIFVAALIPFAMRLTVSAATRPALQAPPRSDPAPDSPPRP